MTTVHRITMHTFAVHMHEQGLSYGVLVIESPIVKCHLFFKVKYCYILFFHSSTDKGAHHWDPQWGHLQHLLFLEAIMIISWLLAKTRKLSWLTIQKGTKYILSLRESLKVFTLAINSHYKVFGICYTEYSWVLWRSDTVEQYLQFADATTHNQVAAPFRKFSYPQLIPAG